ncbi:MAG: hypothetical protein JSS02_03900 [Planctomycetes bacterium]|nr:hypothetical protein [Planctomycetota bacterium]
MNGISFARIRRFGIAVLPLLALGCRNYQLPSLHRSEVGRDQVNQSFTYHDPNSDVDAGPWVERPRGFERARAAPRRTEEKFEITNQRLNNDGGSAVTPMSASRYPDSVTP